MAKSDMAKERPWGGNTFSQTNHLWKLGDTAPASQGATEKPHGRASKCTHDSPLETGDVFYLSNPTIRGWWKKNIMPWFWSSLQTNWIQLVWYFQPYFLSFPRLGLPAVPQRGAGWESCTNRQTLRLPWTDSPGVHDAVGSVEYLNMDRNHLVASHWGFRKQWVSILEWSKDDFGLLPFWVDPFLNKR